jgi:hypothetical protein
LLFLKRDETKQSKANETPFFCPFGKRDEMGRRGRKGYKKVLQSDRKSGLLTFLFSK